MMWLVVILFAMTDRKKAYRKYLLTEHWKVLRDATVARDGKCVDCGETESLEAHHKFYRPKWEDTLLEDLKTLCRTCHRIEHGLPVRFVPSPFLIKSEETEHQLNYGILPKKEDEIELVRLAESAVDEWQVESIFRRVAGYKLANTKVWEYWVKKRDILHRMWQWSIEKRKRIQRQIKERK